MYKNRSFQTFRAAGGMADPCWLGCRVAGYVLPPIETWLSCVRNGAGRLENACRAGSE